MFGLEDYIETKVLKRHPVRYVPDQAFKTNGSSKENEDFDCFDDELDADYSSSDYPIFQIENDSKINHHVNNISSKNADHDDLPSTINYEESSFDSSGLFDFCDPSDSSDSRVLSEDSKSEDQRIFCSCSKDFSKISPNESGSFKGIGLERSIQDLSELLTNPAATFFFRVSGKAMRNDGITEEDILIVDRSREVKNGDIVVATVGGCYIVRRLEKRGGIWSLTSSCHNYRSIELQNNRQIWGVVTSIVHRI